MQAETETTGLQGTGQQQQQQVVAMQQQQQQQQSLLQHMDEKGISNQERQHLRNLIQQHLQMRSKTATNQWAGRLAGFCDQLEHQLYVNAATREDYIDESTLDKRLQFAASKLVSAQQNNSLQQPMMQMPHQIKAQQQQYLNGSIKQQQLIGRNGAGIGLGGKGGMMYYPGGGQLGRPQGGLVQMGMQQPMDVSGFGDIGQNGIGPDMFAGDVGKNIMQGTRYPDIQTNGYMDGGNPSFVQMPRRHRPPNPQSMLVPNPQLTNYKLGQQPNFDMLQNPQMLQNRGGGGAQQMRPHRGNMLMPGMEQFGQFSQFNGVEQFSNGLQQPQYMGQHRMVASQPSQIGGDFDGGGLGFMNPGLYLQEQVVDNTGNVANMGPIDITGTGNGNLFSSSPLERLTGNGTPTLSSTATNINQKQIPQPRARGLQNGSNMVPLTALQNNANNNNNNNGAVSNISLQGGNAGGGGAMQNLQTPFANTTINSPPMGASVIGSNIAGSVIGSNGNAGIIPGMDAAVNAGARMVPVGQVQFQQSNEERVKQRNRVSKQQRMLLFLRHCAKCSNAQCQYGKHCQQGRDLWQHIAICKDSDCKYSRCVQSRMLLKHHLECESKTCPVCVPVKAFVKLQKQQHVSSAAATHTAAPLSQGMKMVDGGNKRVAPLPLEAEHQKRSRLAQAQQQNQAHQQQQQHAYLPQNTTQEQAAPDMNIPSPVEAVSQSNQTFSPKDIRVNCECVSACERMTEEELRMHIDLCKVDVKNMIKEHEKNSRGAKQQYQYSQQITQQKQIQDQQGQQDMNDNRDEVMSINRSDSTVCGVCGEGLLYCAPPNIYCYQCQNQIKKNLMYYTPIPQLEMKSYCWCNDCYKKSEDNMLKIDSTFSIHKEELEKHRNEQEVHEPWVECSLCRTWIHMTCGLLYQEQNSEDKEYYCPHCLLEHPLKEPVQREQLPQHMLAAEHLEKSALSDFLEAALDQVLNEYAQGVDVPQLTVRVVNSISKRLQVKPEFLSKFGENGDEQTLPSHLEQIYKQQIQNGVQNCTQTETLAFPAEIGYRQRVIVMFQKQAGVDVILFVFYVHEFEQVNPADKEGKCCNPNARTVYLSYLDSAQLMQPEGVEVRVDTLGRPVSGKSSNTMKLRTLLYHTLLQGYLENAKIRGFTSVHIWACPPINGDDYILYCKPHKQKMPKPTRLREWYKILLERSITCGIVKYYTTLYDAYFPEGKDHQLEKVKLIDLPYFEGDFWPDQVDTILKQVKTNANSAACVVSSGRSKGKRHEPKSIHTHVFQQFKEVINNVKEDFFVIHLQWPCCFCRQYIGLPHTGRVMYQLNKPYSSLNISSEKKFEGIPLEQCAKKEPPTRLQLCKSCYEEEHRRLYQGTLCERGPRRLPINVQLSDLEEVQVQEIPSTIQPQEDFPVVPHMTPNSSFAVTTVSSVASSGGAHSPQALSPNEIKKYGGKQNEGRSDRIGGEYFDSRQNLLAFCQQNHLQFDCSRRARYATLMILAHLHASDGHLQLCHYCNQGDRDPLTSDASQDKGGLKMFHCDRCNDFQVCVGCLVRCPKTTDGQHSVCTKCQLKGKYNVLKQTDASGFGGNGGQSYSTGTGTQLAALTNHQQGDQEQHVTSRQTVNRQTGAESRQNLAGQLRHDQLARISLLLIHASSCSGANCNIPTCPKMKALFQHQRTCKDRVSGGCTLCKRMLCLLTLHARRCTNPQCPVPRCQELRQLKQHIQSKENHQRCNRYKTLVNQQAKN